MAKIMLATGLIVVDGCTMEAFMAWDSGSIYELGMLKNRAVAGLFAVFYWCLLFCNALVPQFLWFKKVRENVYALFAVAIMVNIGMWLERFVIVMTLSRDFMPSMWGRYMPTLWDWTTYIGSIGLFLFL